MATGKVQKKNARTLGAAAAYFTREDGSAGQSPGIWRIVITMADLDLVESFRRGDPEAFRRLYRDFGRLVHAAAYAVLGDRALADEATQQTFVSAWQHAGRFEAGRELAPWLSVIAKRAAIDIWRRERRRSHESLDELGSLADPRSADDVEDVWAIRSALESLSDDARSLLELQYRHGFSQSDVAARLGIPVGTVKSRTHTAQARLAAALRRHNVGRRTSPMPEHERAQR